MTTPQTFNEEILIAYLKGELDAAIAASVEQWYDASPENQQLLGQIYRILYINDRINAAAEFDAEAALRRFRTRMHRKQGRHRTLRIVWRSAAAVIAAALLAGGIHTYRVAERLAQPLTVTTQLGERSQIVLPDGSHVWLNSCSSVEYSSPLFTRERRVRMTGEAYFVVEKDPKAPFIVTTGEVGIRVLGTRFNVRNDEQYHRITTVLLEGSVEARIPGCTTPVRLLPDQQLEYDTRTGQLNLVRCPDTTRTIGWIDGKLRFERNTLSEIVDELERYYNVDIIFADRELMQERFSGDFSVGDGIYHIFSILQLTDKFRYDIDGNNIVLHKK